MTSGRGSSDLELKAAIGKAFDDSWRLINSTSGWTSSKSATLACDFVDRVKLFTNRKLTKYFYVKLSGRIHEMQDRRESQKILGENISCDGYAPRSCWKSRCINTRCQQCCIVESDVAGTAIGKTIISRIFSQFFQGCENCKATRKRYGCHLPNDGC